MNGYIKYFGFPFHIICDQDPTFMSSLAQYILQHFGIKILTVGITNDKSLLVDHGLKSLSNILRKHLSGLGLA